MQEQGIPRGPIAIDRKQRDAIYEDVVSLLSTTGDIYADLLHDDVGRAKRRRVEFERGAKLLDDLGWQRDVSGDSFELTQPADELGRLLRLLRDDSAGGMAASLFEQQDEQESAQRQAFALATYVGLLRQLGEEDLSPSPYRSVREERRRRIDEHDRDRSWEGAAVGHEEVESQGGSAEGSTMWAVIEVLRGKRKPMTAGEIYAEIRDRKLAPGLKGKTPEATVASQLAVNAKARRYVERPERGKFQLKRGR